MTEQIANHYQDLPIFSVMDRFYPGFSLFMAVQIETTFPSSLCLVMWLSFLTQLSFLQFVTHVLNNTEVEKILHKGMKP